VKSGSEVEVLTLVCELGSLEVLVKNFLPTDILVFQRWVEDRKLYFYRWSGQFLYK
jgi:hypothetical protein